MQSLLNRPLLNSGERQEGYTVLGLILAVAITGVIAIQFTERLEYELTIQTETATVNDITQLAQVQLNHRWEKGDWEMDIDDLLRYAAVETFRNLNGVGETYDFDLTSAPTLDPFFVPSLIITTDLRSKGSALRVAKRLGSFAKALEDPDDPDSREGPWLRVEYAVPLGPLATLDAEYLRRDGREAMLGTLRFDSGADIDMNDNQIRNASRVTARTASGIGLVNADNGAIDTLTVQNFRYVISP